jgi:hypothetical protein
MEMHSSAFCFDTDLEQGKTGTAGNVRDSKERHFKECECMIIFLIL